MVIEKSDCITHLFSGDPGHHAVVLVREVEIIVELARDDERGDEEPVHVELRNHERRVGLQYLCRRARPCPSVIR